MGETGVNPETDLARRSRAGDRLAFEQLVRCCGRWVYAQLYLQTRDPHRAEDLTQETFLTAWRSIHTLTDPAAVRGWLASIAQRTLLDDHRHESRKKCKGIRAGVEELDALSDPARSPPQQAELDEQRKRALEMLAGLPEEYRLPLMLRYLGGADYESISKQLALTNGSLRGLLNRGMALLRERMKT